MTCDLERGSVTVRRGFDTRFTRKVTGASRVLTWFKNGVSVIAGLWRGYNDCNRVKSYNGLIAALRNELIETL